MMSDNPPMKSGLLELLRRSVGTQFVIPVYQRNYTWTIKKEVKQFFNDIKDVVYENYKNHFLGIIIYLETPVGTFNHEFSVIDGQQRITTTFLLIYALRDILLEKGDVDSAAQLEMQYLQNTGVEDKLKLKLKPLVSDDDVYQYIVNKRIEDIKNKESNVLKNYIYLKEELKIIMEDGISLETFIRALDKVYLVCVPLSKNDNAQKIFESINSTGAKLTASDLIRNYILMTIPSDKQDFYFATYWKPMEENLLNDSKKLEMFFRIFLAAKMKVLTNINAVYDTFKTWYEEEKRLNSVEDILKDIKNYSYYYNVIYYKKLNMNTDLERAIYDFRRMKMDMPAPLLVDFYRLYDEKLITEKTLSNLFNYVTIYLLRRSLCSCDSSPISRIFPSILNSTLSACDEKYSNIEEVFKKYLVNANKAKSSYMPDDKELREHLYNDNMYICQAIRFVLDKIEMENSTAPVDLSTLSIEHLMPQDGSKWLEKLGIDEDEYLKQRNRLGNLTLISKSDNSKAQNNIWEFKKELFSSTSHIKLNQYILSRPTWNVEEIEIRTKLLMDKIVSIFPYFSAKIDTSDIIPIHIATNDKDFEAKGLFYCDSGAVEIFKDSMITDYLEDQTADSYVRLFDSLLDDGIIEERSDGFYFTENKTFYSERQNATALSTTAGLILNGSRNGKEYWLDEYNNQINKNEVFLKSKYGK